MRHHNNNHGMKVFILNDKIIIMFQAIVLVSAKGTKQDIPRLMLVAQENLIDWVA